eukprot:COSAG02_NODE_17337_length_1011_cov_1.395833_1_plen_172_part_01
MKGGRTASRAASAHLLAVVVVVLLQQQQLGLRLGSAQVTCGDGTTQVANECVASHTVAANNSGDIFLAGIFDMRSQTGYAAMTRHHFQLAVDLINDRNDGFFDDYCVGADGRSVSCTGGEGDVRVDMMLPTIHTELSNSACDENMGAEAYWSARPSCDGSVLHGVIGCRCSG